MVKSLAQGQPVSKMLLGLVPRDAQVFLQIFAFLRINVHSDHLMFIRMGFSNGLTAGKEDRHCDPPYQTGTKTVTQ